MATNLSQKKCVPCKGGVEPMNINEASKMLSKINDRWELTENGSKLYATFVFDDFKSALSFVNKVGEIAESEDHHPDIKIFDYKNVGITLFTHKIGGLHENDFILAAKVDEIV